MGRISTLDGKVTDNGVAYSVEGSLWTADEIYVLNFTITSENY